MYPKLILVMHSAVLCSSAWLELSGTCYWLSEDKANFTEANATCETMGAPLWQIETPEEYGYIVNKLDKEMEFWLGLHFNGTDFLWKDETMPTKSFWFPGEPNNSGQCARLVWNAQVNVTTPIVHMLRDHPCQSQYHYICKKEGNFVGVRKAFALSNKADESLMSNFCVVKSSKEWGKVACAAVCQTNIPCEFYRYDVTTMVCEQLVLPRGNCQSVDFSGSIIYDVIRDCSVI